MSPVFAHGHLRLYLLVLLADHPMHGYEVIQALGDRFGGTYVPSAGTVYPRLAKLQEDGLVTGSSDGRKTVYAITEAGRTELAARQDEVAAIESGVTDSVRSLADGVRASVGQAMRSLRADLASSARGSNGTSRDSGTGSGTGRGSGQASPGPQVSSRALSEIDIALTTFRQDVRADLRRRATRGSLTPETVQRLRDGLEALRRSL